MVCRWCVPYNLQPPWLHTGSQSAILPKVATSESNQHVQGKQPYIIVVTDLLPGSDAVP